MSGFCLANDAIVKATGNLGVNLMGLYREIATGIFVACLSLSTGHAEDRPFELIARFGQWPSLTALDAGLEIYKVVANRGGCSVLITEPNGSIKRGPLKMRVGETILFQVAPPNFDPNYSGIIPLCKDTLIEVTVSYNRGDWTYKLK